METALARLAAARRRTVRRGQILFHPGDAVESIYVLRRGRIKLVRNTEDGNTAVLQVACAGDLLAEASMFSRTYHCMAAVDTRTAELACFDRGALLAALSESPAAALEVMELFALRIRRLRALLEIRNIRSAKGRILAFLQQESSGGEVPLESSLKDMARQLGLAHETFYRELKKLEDEREIVRMGRCIHLRRHGR